MGDIHACTPTDAARVWHLIKCDKFYQVSFNSKHSDIHLQCKWVIGVCVLHTCYRMQFDFQLKGQNRNGVL